MRARRSILHPRLDRALIALAVLCVLMMPVEYRGGAETPHAHAVFQFWDTGIASAFDHHGHDHGTAGRHANDDVLPTLDSVALGGRLLPAAVSGQIATATSSPPDVPQLSKMTASAERAAGLAVAVSVVLALLALTVLRRLPIAAVRIPAGLTPAPDAPPPRAALAAAFPLG
ncbi:MAG: hypothetical protein ACRDJW_10085 [Thermomicrobiales bacterium]